MFGLSKRMLIVIGILVVVVVIFVIQGRNPNNSQSGSSSGQCQVKVVNATALNIRSSPATSGQVVGTLQDGQVINADKTIQNGFRQLNTNQWVSNQFLTPVSGSC